MTGVPTGGVVCIGTRGLESLGRRSHSSFYMHTYFVVLGMIPLSSGLDISVYVTIIIDPWYSEFTIACTYVGSDKKIM